jgi:hypothetical protein
MSPLFNSREQNKLRVREKKFLESGLLHDIPLWSLYTVLHQLQTIQMCSYNEIQQDALFLIFI